MWQRIKIYLHNSLESHESGRFLGIQLFISFTTVVSVIAIALETVSPLHQFLSVFIIIEWVATIIFSLEYIARLIIAKTPASYIFSFWGFIDILAIIPTFLSLGNWTFLKSARTLRLLRLARILRLSKMSRAYLSSHGKAKTEAELTNMTLTIYFLALGTSTVLIGTLFYIFETSNENYSNIPISMYQTLRVLMGGAGNAEPLFSWTGGFIAIFASFTGLVLFALLIAMVAGLVKELLLGSKK